MSSVSLVKVLKHGLKKYKDPQDFLNFLQKFEEKKAIKLVGTGYFSKVFQHPENPDRVIKISGTKGKVSDGAIEYCYWIWKNNIKMPGIPIIHNIVKYNNYYYVEMDHHGEVFSENDDDSYLNNVRLALSNVLNYGTIRFEVDSEETQQLFFDKFIPYVNTILKIRNEFREKFSVDLHAGNITLDKEGKIWFIDPLGFSC